MKKLYLFNTLTRQKEEFIPLMEDENYKGPKKDFVWIYSCGPTVYSMPHLWNLRQAFFADFLKAVLKNILWYNVKLVSNITDVGHIVGDTDRGEDKIEKWAKKEWLTVWEIAKKYENIFLDYFRKLNVDSYDVMPRATEYIQEQLEMVKKLEEKWYTYIIPNDWVYMDTSKLTDYWKLLWPQFKKHLEGLKAWARVDFEGKRNLTDFALWKFSPTNEKRQMEWDSPWWKSFPGWHIECSAMSKIFLWDQFDIHHWWYDLIPVHHTNEIAQSESFCECKPWVKYWVHHQFVNVNGEKMSKSKWNGVEIEDILSKWYTFIDLRYFFLTWSYRNFLDFTWDNIQTAKNSRQNIIKKLSKLFEKYESQVWEPNYDNIKDYDQFDNVVLKSQKWSELFNNIIDSLCDDFNTADILSHIHKWFIELEDEIELIDLLNIILYLDNKLLKLDLYKDMIFDLNKKELDIPNEIKDLAERRWNAKQNRNFQEADVIRQQLLWLGYEIKDSKEWYEIVKI